MNRIKLTYVRIFKGEDEKDWQDKVTQEAFSKEVKNIYDK